MAGKKKATPVAAASSGVKQTRQESAAGEAEDTFQVGPYRARTKHAAPASDAAADALGELLEQCRSCPRVLVAAMKGLNDPATTGCLYYAPHEDFMREGLEHRCFRIFIMLAFVSSFS